MNINEMIEHCKSEYEFGWVAVNDDNEIFWSNERPSLQDGYWASFTKTFETAYVGRFTGIENWRRTLREIN